jgi:hypothetical protein
MTATRQICLAAVKLLQTPARKCHPSTAAAGLLVAVCFTGCATDRTTFLNYGGRVPPDVMTAPQVSDGLAINYANSVEIIMRCNATRSRITREVSATAQVGLAAFGGVGAAYNWDKTTLTVLGLASAAIPQLQGIFDAKGRAEAYNQAAEKIQDGVLEYYAHNPAPSSGEFTPNGLTLVKRVASAINLVNDTINGHLPSQASMQKAVEPMTPQGNEPQNPDEPPVNERVRTAAAAKVQVINTVSAREFQALKEQVQVELSKRPGNIDFVSALTQIDRDPSITNKTDIYAAIVTEAGVAGKITPPADANKINEFYQTQATADERTKLTDAVNRRIRKQQ